MNRRRALSASAMSGGSAEPIDISNYLTIVALENGLTAKLSVNACEYCIDGDGDWKTLSAAANTKTINKGQTLSFRGNLTPNGSIGIGTFTISKSCNLEGNCMSMLFGDDAASDTSLSGKDYAFSNLFKQCTTIKSVSSGFLPATSLATYCYYYMFFSCTSLTQAPELPATTLASYCYRSMFSTCTSLTQAPELPATTLSSRCYGYMFYNCTSLTTAPELPATTLASYCYEYMFYGTNVLPDFSNINFSSKSIVSSGGLIGLFAGTKVTDADLERILPKNSNGKYCLPVTTLADYCYYSMFSDCTSLTTAPTLPATTLKRYCYQNMFSDCTSLTTAPTLPATSLATYCYYYMFSGCTSLTQAPELPATTLVANCYEQMFRNCSKLNYIKAMFTTTPSKTYTYNWVYNVSSTGKFIKNKNATWNVTGVNGIPSGWSVQSAAQ